MSESDLISLTHRTEIQSKSRTGEIKTIVVIQPMDPDQRKLELKDLQILAREISKILKEDG